MLLTVLNILALLLFLATTVVLARRDLVKTYLLFPLIFQGLGSIPSLIYIENGGYISEQGRSGHFNGATLYFTFYIVATLVLSWLGVGAFQRSMGSVGTVRLRKDYPVLVVFLQSLLAVAYLNLLLSPIPLLSDRFDRFDYWSVAQFPFLKHLLGNVSAFLVIGAGVVYLHRQFMGKLLFVLYLAYLILLGHKFGSLIIAAYMFYLPHVVFNAPPFRLSFFLRPWIVAAGLGVFLLIYIHYGYNNPLRHVVGDDVLLAIFYRALGLQGHVWWGMIEHAKLHTPSYNIYELAYGMHSLMYVLSGNPELVDLGIERGVSFTNGYPAILLKVFPLHLVFLFHLGIIVVTALLTAIVIRLIQARQWLLTVASAQMISWWFHMLLMGYFYKVTQIAIVLLFIAAYLIILHAVGRTSHFEPVPRVTDHPGRFGLNPNRFARPA